MKRLNAFLVSVLATVALNAAEANTAVIEQVIVRQQWPWSTDVKIEYKLKGVSSPVNVSVEAYNGDEKLDQSRLEKSLSGDRFGVTDVVGTIILDPVKAFGTEKVALANFKVKLSVSDSAQNETEVIYKVVDLVNFSVTDVRRCDFHNGNMGAYVTDFAAIGEGYNTALDDVLIWTEVTNNPVYKTTKLVMRKIPHGTFRSDTTGQYVSWAEDNKCNITVDSDYFIGVFPVTRKQFILLTATGGTPGNLPKGQDYVEAQADYPVLYASYSNLRGSPEEWKDSWPEDAHEVTPRSFIGVMRENIKGYHVDLPTAAEWEKAARAGTETMYYDGLVWAEGGAASYKAALAKIGWSSETASSAMPVGQLKPNAFGLYDTLGNVMEACRDLALEAKPAASTVDLTNPFGCTDLAAVRELGTSLYYLEKGGSFYRPYTYCRPATRSDNNKIGTQTDRQGFRLWMVAK